MTGHGRAAPLIWLTVWKEEIATRRNDYADACLRRLAETMPPDCRVTILAERGFGDQKLFAFLLTLGFGYVIRFLRFGMGFSSTRIGEPMRRDRLLLISAFAMALLTLLGAVGESLGMDRLLKSNTSKTRSHSLFRQGCMLYELIPNMPEHRLTPLMAAFEKAVSNASAFSGLFAKPI